MVESSALLMSRNNVFQATAVNGMSNVVMPPLPSASSSASSSSGSSAATTATVTASVRAGVLETRVRGAWYRVLVTLETDYLSVSLDEACDPSDHTTTLNGTLG